MPDELSKLYLFVVLKNVRFGVSVPLVASIKTAELVPLVNAWIVPLTSNLYAGLAVPIPTLVPLS